MISGQVCRQIEQWVPDALKMADWLSAMPDADLMAPPYGYTSDEVALLKSAFTDLALLAKIYKGLETLDPARDLSVFAKRLAGLYV
jgi:hypothetical protein